MVLETILRLAATNSFIDDWNNGKRDAAVRNADDLLRNEDGAADIRLKALARLESSSTAKETLDTEHLKKLAKKLAEYDSVQKAIDANKVLPVQVHQILTTSESLKTAVNSYAKLGFTKIARTSSSLLREKFRPYAKPLLEHLGCKPSDHQVESLIEIISESTIEGRFQDALPKIIRTWANEIKIPISELGVNQWREFAVKQAFEMTAQKYEDETIKTLLEREIWSYDDQTDEIKFALKPIQALYHNNDKAFDIWENLISRANEFLNLAV